ncbi:SdpI family protein [Enterococcus mediterraneensis]|uniref:SdpI family protein n=1 Tax=Enterococcus mediterraneensis TaxID=2364791 RepID=UPI000F04869A|nr:SdpI family protein [Enterococcus mediterraneensis]
MIFLVIGIGFTLIGLLFSIFPAKYDNLVYGYRSYLSKMNELNWRYAQRISGMYFLLFGLLMAVIGLVLKLTGNTNFFIIEMILIPFPIVVSFGLIEERLKAFDRKNRGEENEYLDD